MKQRSGKGLESLQAKVEELNGGGGSHKDPRFWNMTLDSTASGSAVIRFLPALDDETPIAKEITYFFRGKGGIFSELSPASIGGECPVRDRNSEEWRQSQDTGDKDLENSVRARRQNVKFTANILVVDDPANPDNNGKVFLFKFGKQIKNIIDKAIKPEYADETPIDPFDLWFGANFKFRSKGREVPDNRSGKKVMVPNYEDSKFSDPIEIFPGDDAKKEETWKQTLSLAEFTDPKRFKDYDTLKAQMEKVIGGSGPVRKAADDNGEEEEYTPPMQDQTKPAATVEDKAPEEKAATPADDSDSDMAFFASLGK